MDKPPENEPAPEPSWRRDPDKESDGTIEENWLFRLRRERYISRKSGKAHAYYVMHLADSVNVIAVTPSNEVVLVRQFRAGSSRDSLEPPGGLIEPGEDPCAAGERELMQETGYTGDPAVLIGSVWSNPSIMTARSYTILVENAVQVTEPLLDAEEEVAVELVAEEAIPRMIKDGSIDHALSVLGLLWWLCGSGLG
jgi:8-oxo-dGTP pyrophosphatase MutT (NUDIX family)